MSYNMAADSFQWSDLSVGLRLKLSKSYTLNLNGVFDTYTYGYDERTNRAYRVNVPRWKALKKIKTRKEIPALVNNRIWKELQMARIKRTAVC